MSPVTPAITGTYPLSHSLGMRYTIGRSVVADAVHRILTQSGGTAAVDIETYGLGVDARRIKCVTIAHTGEAVVLDPREEFQANLIRNTIADLDVLIFHNSPFDVPNLVLNGLMTEQDIAKVEDTMIYARLAEPDRLTKKDLTTLTVRYLELSPSHKTRNQVFKELGFKISEGWEHFDLDRPSYIFGAAWDGLVTARVRDLVKNAAHRRLTTGHPFRVWGLSSHDAWKLVEREQIINRLFLRRSVKGLRVDEEYLIQYRAQVEVAKMKAELALSEVGIRPGNANDLVAYLEKINALPATHPRTATGKPQTTAKVLEELQHPIARQYVQQKQIAKVLNDYLAKVVQLASDGRVHPDVQLLSAVTGRMAYSNPAFQQYSPPARGIILADEDDQLTSLDWSQIEPVIAANIAKDYGALAEYESGTGDLYQGIAATAGIQRKQAKVVLLAQLYGQGIRALASNLNISEDEAWSLKRSVFAAMPDTEKLITTITRTADQHRLVPTLSGRIIPVPTFTTDSGFKKVAAYKAVNYLIQGSAYDVLAEALVQIEDHGLGDAVYVAMHDEIVCSTDAAHDVRKIMDQPPDRLIQIAGQDPVLRTDKVDLGDRWAA
jgi:DNA polymerase-1